MQNNMLKVIFAIFLLVAMSRTTFASYPSYNTETDCRSCHGITADRHHFLVANGTYVCTDCHPMKYDTTNQTYYPEVIRNCLTCHVGKDHTDAHHLLVQQGLFVCSDCHPVKYDAQNQTYYPEIIWDCTVCHSTVLRPGSPVPPPVPLPKNPPAITSFSPASPTLDIVGATRKFNVTFDQTVNLTWYIDDTPVQDNNSITEASYINSSAVLGIWNVSVNASNVNGSIMFTWTWNVTSTPPPPTITSSSPPSPVNDTVGSSRKFGITIDQTANITWYINGIPVQYNNNVTGASYNNTSATVGVWNVDAIASNANGSVMQTWIWNVTPIPPPPVITSFAPSSPVNDPVGSSRKFNITINQTVNVKWYFNGTEVSSNTSVTTANYTNTSAKAGIWNVSAIASNANGRVTQTWIWNVTPTGIDNTPPQITINSPNDGKVYILNQKLIADWSVSDASGIAMATGTYSNGSNIPTSSVGTKNFIVNAKDKAGNTNTTNVTYYIRYTYGGILRPINADGNSVFKFRSTIPVKFQLKDANGNFVTNSVAKIYVAKLSGTVTGTELQAISTSAATTGNLFRYDSKNNQYIFNLATKTLSTGTWRIRVDINDGSSYAVNISLQNI